MVDTVAWGGYDFYVYDPTRTRWRDVGGVYIFAGVNASNVWEPFYIGRTNSLKDRLSDHERWDEARALGATHIHTRVERAASRRKALEEHLLDGFGPPLNERI